MQYNIFEKTNYRNGEQISSCQQLKVRGADACSGKEFSVVIEVHVVLVLFCLLTTVADKQTNV